MLEKNGIRYCDRCGVLLTQENNKCGYTLNSEEPLLSMKQEADLFEATYKALDEEICEDAISRKDMALNIVSFYNKATGKKKTLDFLCKCVEGLPSVQPKQRWIPVSERLPDEDDVYLVTMNVLGRSIRDIERFRIDNKGWGVNGNNEVTAWMPLPEPYKAESSPRNI